MWEEIDALLTACRDVQAEPWNEEAAIRLIRLAGSILNYHDTAPGSPGESARLDRMNALVRIVRSDLGDAEANEVAALVPDLTSDTPNAESAALRLKPILLRLGRVGYDVATTVEFRPPEDPPHQVRLAEERPAEVRLAEVWTNGRLFCSPSVPDIHALPEEVRDVQHWP